MSGRRLAVVSSNSKPMKQTGALPFARAGDDIQIALITTRRRKRWIIPKGWPEKGCSLAHAAAREADEEAGVLGDIGAEPVGKFDYVKFTATGDGISCRVIVFPLHARCQRLDWKERQDRQLRWVDLDAAAGMIAEPGLAELLADLAAAPDRLIGQDAAGRNAR